MNQMLKQKEMNNQILERELKALKEGKRKGEGANGL
jgi:hypothetical protein